MFEAEEGAAGGWGPGAAARCWRAPGAMLLQTNLCINVIISSTCCAWQLATSITTRQGKSVILDTGILLYSGSYCLVLLFLTFAVISFVTISILS